MGSRPCAAGASDERFPDLASGRASGRPPGLRDGGAAGGDEESPRCLLRDDVLLGADESTAPEREADPGEAIPLVVEVEVVVPGLVGPSRTIVTEDR